jgi:hypothetical protein
MISGDFNANKELSFGICSQSSTYQNHRLYDLGWNWPNRSDEKGPDSNDDDSNYPQGIRSIHWFPPKGTQWSLMMRKMIS